MQILKDSISGLAFRAYAGMQVPMYAVMPPGTSAKAEEAPDDWFLKLNYRHDPVVGKESYYLFLSRKGWEANKAKIKKTFESAQHNLWTWADFEKYAEGFHADVERRRKRRIETMEKKVEQLKAVEV